MENNKNLLQNLLLRENNNFDLIRLIAAWLVIYGHANAMIPPVYQRDDAIAVFLRFDYSGTLAVKVFFFLSGLVVANSLLEKKNILQFVVARFFRIWPAFLLVLFFTSFVTPLKVSFTVSPDFEALIPNSFILSNSPV